MPKCHFNKVAKPGWGFFEIGHIRKLLNLSSDHGHELVNYLNIIFRAKVGLT